LASSRNETGRSAIALRTTIESFLKNCREPAVLEPGEEILPLTADNYCRGALRGARARGSRSISAARAAANWAGKAADWCFESNWTRRIRAAEQANNARLEARCDPTPEIVNRHPRISSAWEFSLSPSFPRAYLKPGKHGWAAIACPQTATRPACSRPPYLACVPAATRAAGDGRRSGSIRPNGQGARQLCVSCA
jgi:hypothetical protein